MEVDLVEIGDRSRCDPRTQDRTASVAAGQRERVTDRPELVATMRSAIAQWRSGWGSDAPTVEIDSETEEHLRALGYVD